MTLQRTDATDPAFIELVQLLNYELETRDGKEHAYYAQFNEIDNLKHVVLLYDGNKPVACGAMKPFDRHTMEVKRMYTRVDSRGLGCATQILNDLEKWALELGYDSCCLETGKRQPEAIELYKDNAYQIIPNYGQYEGIENSVCFRKSLKESGF